MTAAIPSRPARSAMRATLLYLALASGCATTATPAPAPPPAAPAATPAPAAQESEVPPILRELDLTPAQEAEILRIRADLRRDLEPLGRAAGELGRSVAGAARLCKGDTPFVEMDAERAVRVGEEVRGSVLDAVQRLHRLLTPAQRKKLSLRLLEGDEWAKRERRNESRTRGLAPVLDLSISQTMQMLVKARILWSSFADRIEPWRIQYEGAVTRFARDDFDARQEPVGKAPAVLLTTEFVRTGLRLLIPILDRQQCEALGRVIDEKLDEQAARAAAQEAGKPSEQR
jgi:Spy/CpxP family protein refolding chaperone